MRIAPHQRYKYAETKLTLFYKDIIDEIVDKNKILQSSINTLIDLNNGYKRNADEFEAKIKAEEKKTTEANKLIEALSAEYEEKMEKMEAEQHAEKLEDKKKHLQIVETM